MDGHLSDSGGIAGRVRVARERLGWTREALAVHAGLSWSAIAQVESGRRTNLRPSTLAALARALGVSIDYLVDGTPAPRPNMLEHAVFAYRTGAQFQARMGPFLAAGVKRSEATLAVTSVANIEMLREYLGQDAGSVQFLDADRFYSTPMAVLDAYRVFVESALERGAPWIRLIGEPMPSKTSDAEARAWTRYESMFNLVFAASPLTVVCPYNESALPADIVAHAHLTHPSILGDRGVSESPRYTDPARFALERE